MKRVQLLCDGCVKPIMEIPFYICYQRTDEQCFFVLHEWCAKLPTKIEGYDGHPQHTLVLLPKIPDEFFGVFKCAICFFASNGFAYGCTMCKYYVDINCSFIPKEITHDSHTDHILSKVNPSAKLINRFCNACNTGMDNEFGFHCPSCDFYIHVECALFLPKIIKHKCDQHPLSLRYEPVQNQLGEYFCEETDLLHHLVVEVTVELAVDTEATLAVEVDTEVAVVAVTEDVVAAEVDTGPAIQVLKGGTSTPKRCLLKVTKVMEIAAPPSGGAYGHGSVSVFSGFIKLLPFGEILLEIKKSFKDVNNVLYDWTNPPASYYCMWRGVSCDNFGFIIQYVKRRHPIFGIEAEQLELLSSCSESQRDATLLLGQFAIVVTDCKVHIVQRSVVGPLIELLWSPYAQLREISAFALVVYY
ncbi:hypothetical protein E3N88_38467 [Mikania micrantha]|uniref:Phorbol-ester/DAG-type domain-containing protein n=1 Tax=Mikania micrantha TaxID=192012 RepID=A0A5N6LUC3_9ASTR|nr:hypothetical protein E3N88_38467 [Mikania micrantha]